MSAAAGISIIAPNLTAPYTMPRSSSSARAWSHQRQRLADFAGMRQHGDQQV
jgi:hypothetical protein